ncbi:MAG: hypothetical protein M1817_002915 [Caeruleum heppii]|nr:MAG: hypothetical protein M1817_002915 [Caeruleum heppii]
MPPSTPPTPTQQALQTANQTYASTFSPSTLPPGPSPTKHLAIVTCMDARIHPEAAFGLALGDAHVIRNGGGWAKDALRSLVPSQQLLGTREVVVVKHTDCGYTHLKHPLLYGKIGLNLGVSAASQASSMDFLPFTE